MADIFDTVGTLEDAPDDRMVVRVLGINLGTCDGWMHGGGHTVVMPSFAPNDTFATVAPDIEVPPNTALIVDYYIGLLALVQHAPAGSNEPVSREAMWTARISSKLGGK